MEPSERLHGDAAWRAQAAAQAERDQAADYRLRTPKLLREMARTETGAYRAELLDRADRIERGEAA